MLNDVTERVAQALYENCYNNPDISWESYRTEKPDLAAIFRRNASVAIDAYEKSKAA